MKILANDGISDSGKKKLEESGFDVSTTFVEQKKLVSHINKENISILLVRSATKVRKDLIDQCPSIRIVGRGGVGMDNIDVKYAKEKGIEVINTPAASSSSVAELVFAHLYGSVRFLHQSNREMPLDGDKNFKVLKKNYSNGLELRGKTLGILGFGRIGRETAKLAIGIGMKVLVYDKFLTESEIKINFFDGNCMDFKIQTSKLELVLKNSDFLTFHIPAQDNYIIDSKEFDLMKNGVGIINAARGGVINEDELIKRLDNNKISFAALDTFENEPNPSIKLLMHPKISLTPHIGAATNEAQDRIGIELATQIIDILK